VIYYGRFGTTYRSHLYKVENPNSRTTGCPATSVRNYHYSLRNKTQKSAVVIRLDGFRETQYVVHVKINYVCRMDEKPD
jgi:hypothetical protein